MWTTDFPSAPGWYWFYGNTYKGSKLKLATVQVHDCGTTFCGGTFMYETELGAIRWFKPLDAPDISELVGE